MTDDTSGRLCSRCGHAQRDHATGHGCTVRLEDRSECVCNRTDFSTADTPMEINAISGRVSPTEKDSGGPLVGVPEPVARQNAAEGAQQASLTGVVPSRGESGRPSGSERVSHEEARKRVLELRESSWWIGWDHTNPRCPTLLRYIDQQAATDQQLAKMREQVECFREAWATACQEREQAKDKLAELRAERLNWMACADALEDVAEGRDVRCTVRGAHPGVYECRHDALCLGCRARAKIAELRAELTSAQTLLSAHAGDNDALRVELEQARAELADALDESQLRARDAVRYEKERDDAQHDLGEARAELRVKEEALDEARKAYARPWSDGHRLQEVRKALYAPSKPTEPQQPTLEVGRDGDCVGHLMDGCTCASCLRARGIEWPPQQPTQSDRPVMVGELVRLLHKFVTEFGADTPVIGDGLGWIGDELERGK